MSRMFGHPMIHIAHLIAGCPPWTKKRCRSKTTAKIVTSKAFDGFADWVDGMHYYRHGQGQPEPVTPPIEFAVYVLSSGAAFLRWLVAIKETAAA